MIYKTIIAFFIVISLYPSQIISNPVENVIKEDFKDKEYIVTLVNTYADYYGVKREVMQAMVWNESYYVYDKHTQNDGGKNWSAYGLSQINMRFWGTKVTKEMAVNPHYALDFMARNIKQGNGKLWTTYRTCVQHEKIIYKGKQIRCNYNNPYYDIKTLI